MDSAKRQTDTTENPSKDPGSVRNSLSHYVVASFASRDTAWGEMFENSVARNLAHIINMQPLNPKFKLNETVFNKMYEAEHKDVKGPCLPPDVIYRRLHSNARQASEILFRLNFYTSNADVVLVDNRMLDTALGHQVLVYAKGGNKPVYAVAVDDVMSPIAPAFIKGVVYPATADDLVKLILKETSNENSF